ncbi:MAG: GtrA family protein [Anaerolineae bacterium]|nr:GtrA family protein [Anaerolineae bacterium]MDW8298030.1 GtrA family protein [Anaerolineae bacterium]
MNRSESLSLAEGERMGIIRRISIRFGGSKPRELERFIKFLVVGSIGALIDLGTTNFLMRFVFQVQDGQLLPVVISAAIGFTLAVCSNFLWNRYWTYPDSRSRRIRYQLAQFFAVSIVGLAVRAGVVAVFSPIFADVVRYFAANHLVELNLADNVQWKLGANMAVIMALVIVALWNFFANRYWTYNDVE